MGLRGVALAFLALALVADRDASACICFPPPPPRQELDRSYGVFEGTITAVVPGVDYDFAKVKVMRRWKAPDAAEIVVATGRTTCGHQFKVGQVWLFYTRSDCGLHASSSCTRTRLAANAAQDLAELGPPLAPGATLVDGGAPGGGEIVDAGTCPPDGGSRDFAVPPDLTQPPDLRPAPDLAAPEDLGAPPDHATPQDDLGAPRDDLAARDLAARDQAASAGADGAGARGCACTMTARRAPSTAGALALAALLVAVAARRRWYGR